METKIGSDKRHTKWCQDLARDCIKRAQHTIGLTAWAMLGSQVRGAFLAAQVLAVVGSQANGDLPLWRMQELVQIAHAMLFEYEDARIACGVQP